jgi:DNA repair exonuclease SbcCD ATPase subunit
MIKLAFLEVELEDFKSFAGRHVVKLDRSIGLHYVGGENRAEPRLGSNGAGKSTIWDAILWCLFGRTSGGLRNPDIMPWSGKGSPRVRLWLRDGGKEQSIERTVKPSALLINGRERGQEKVHELIGMNFEMVTNTIILGQGEDLFFDKSAAQKMSLFDDALNQHRWDERSDRAKAWSGDLVKERASLEGEHRALAGSIASLGKLLDETERRAKEWDEQIEKDRKGTDAELVKRRASVGDLQGKIDSSDLAYDGAMAEVKALEAMAVRENNALRNAQVDLQRVKDRRKRVEELATGLEDALERKKQSKECPTCKQPIKKGDIHEHLEQIKEEIASLDAEWRTLDSKPYQAVVDNHRKMLEDAEGHLRQFRQRAQSHLDMLQRWRPEMAEKKVELKALEARLKATEGDNNPHRDQVKSLRKRLGKAKDDAEACVSDIESVDVDMGQAKTWQKGFKEIKLHIIEDILHELELATDGMLEEIGLVDWKVHYVIERETARGTVQRGLQVMISSPRSKGRVKWESWSGGEGQRLRIVGALALAQVLLNHAGVQPDLEVLDEPAVYWSGEGINELCAYLADRARTLGKRIYYCDHMAIEGAHFNSRLSVIRDKGGSRIAKGA